MNQRRLRQRGRAFTLIETVGALVILAIALPPMMAAMRNARINRVQPMMFSRARWLATEKLEDVIADRYSPTRGYAYLLSGNYPAENPVATDPAFSRTTTINETGPDLQSAGTGYKTATVTITWTDATGTAQSLAISTVAASWDP